jgi:hypothetical protein
MKQSIYDIAKRTEYLPLSGINGGIGRIVTRGSGGTAPDGPPGARSPPGIADSQADHLGRAWPGAGLKDWCLRVIWLQSAYVGHGDPSVIGNLKDQGEVAV